MNKVESLIKRQIRRVIGGDGLSERACRRPLVAAMAMLWLCPFGAGSVAAADDKPNADRKSTIFVVTEPSETQKEPKLQIDFVWAPYCGYSVRAFHDVIAPIEKAYVPGSQGRAVVRFTQATRNETELNGPGPLFLCVPPEHYAEFVIDYLLTAYDNKAYLKWRAKEKLPLKDRTVYKFLIDVGHKYGLPDDISTCYGDAVRTRLLATDSAISQKFDHPKGTPVIAINGTVVKGVQTAAQLNDAIGKALQKPADSRK
jgi:hypothetical protein